MWEPMITNQIQCLEHIQRKNEDIQKVGSNFYLFIFATKKYGTILLTS